MLAADVRTRNRDFGGFPPLQEINGESRARYVAV